MRNRVINKRQIEARLIERGTNFRRFALEKGYKPRTVTQVVDRWVTRKDLPRGRLSYQILIDLSAEIEQEIIPGLWEASA